MEIKNLGLTTVDGKTFTHVEGGFGEGSKCILVKDIAEIHGQTLCYVNLLTRNNISRFTKENDIKDLKQIVKNNVFFEMGFSKSQVENAKNIYLFSERGYAKLLKLMEDDLAWELYDKLVDGYFNMRQEIKRELSATTKTGEKVEANYLALELMSKRFRYSDESYAKISNKIVSSLGLLDCLKIE